MINKIVVTLAFALTLVSAATPARAAVTTHNPVGHVDVFTVDENKYESILISGWAGDFDAGSTPGQRVHLYIDGRGVEAVSTGLPRPDVYRVYPALGQNTGFSMFPAVPPGRGTHTACLYAINRGPGGTTLLGCRAFTITQPHAVIGHIDSFSVDPADPTHRIVRGWALDPYDAVSPTRFGLVWRSGPTQPATLPSDVIGSAGLPRPDVDAVYPRNGHDHGFAISVDPTAAGLDWAPGSTICLGRQAPFSEMTDGVIGTSACAIFPG